jgi:hypothetical protein
MERRGEREKRRQGDGEKRRKNKRLKIKDNALLKNHCNRWGAIFLHSTNLLI